LPEPTPDEEAEPVGTSVSTWLLRLVTLVVSPLILFGLGEGVAWLFGVQALASDPGYPVWHEAQVCHYAGDPEAYCSRPGLEGAEGKAVVAVVGGSSVYGYPKGMKPFPNLLRGMLEEAAPGEFAVRNYGLYCKDSIFVRRCAQTLIERGEPEIVVVYSGHNDFLNFMRRPGPRALFFLENNPWLIGLRDALARSRIYSLLSRERAGAISGVWNRLPSPDFEEAFEVVLDAFTHNVEAIVELAAERGVQVVLVTVASNVSEFPYPRDEWDSGLAPGKNPPEWHDWSVHFAGAIEQAREGRLGPAHESFVAARDDLPMGRAPSQLNQRVRELAARHPEVRLVDFERRIDVIARQELIGCEFFGGTTGGVPWCDPFHPSTRTHRLIAGSVAEALLALRN
jgi:hypothetical protein